MPVMNGLDAVKKYRESHPLGSRPYIVAVTATNLISAEPNSYHAAGMDAFIQKPIKMNEIKALMEVIQR
jgi:CheY-like chemotaxis protein